ncbi:MAG: hypothetical protein COS40_05585 [Deltaproteobacteria bacterium CG03_land_8_20_14_0_80_45_14]|nr:MAG: hypothetical protein COS40_05585 [Deltaproteobacteria bacterium CG03_land_8_20_14_0_80_45_14]
MKTNTFSPLLQRIPKGGGQVLPCSGQNRFTKMEPSPFPSPELTEDLVPGNGNSVFVFTIKY